MDANIISEVKPVEATIKALAEAAGVITAHSGESTAWKQFCREYPHTADYLRLTVLMNT